MCSGVGARLLSILPCFLICWGCAFVDSQIPGRNSILNQGYDIAGNDEILLNILRAKHYQPLRFYLHSKIAPSQTTSASIGLPNITVGPGQTVAQHQFVFGPNSTNNTASMSYEIDPVETQTFYQGLLTPNSLGIIGALLSRYPREFIFLALIDAVKVTQLYPNKSVTRFVNDPGLDDPLACPDFDYSNYDRAAFDQTDDLISIYNPAYDKDMHAGAHYAGCGFHVFQFYLQEAIKYGMTVSVANIPNPKYNPNDTKSTQPKQISVGTLCYDLALARPDVVAELSRYSSSLCGATRATADSPTAVLRFTYHAPRPPSRLLTEVDQKVEIVPRSTAGVFSYLGRLLATNTGESVQLYSREAQANGDVHLLTTVTSNIFPACFVVANLFGDQYCVPARGSDNTKRMFQLLSELIALNSSANDVPTSLTVRVTP
jgi:hypothetical protein